jgi:CubicO group peptidase (beta-lactamase class C family)
MIILRRLRIFMFQKPYGSILTVFILLCAMLLSSCHIGRFFIYNFADVNDYRKFPSLPVNTQVPAFTFFQPSQNTAPALPAEFKAGSEIQDLPSFLRKHKTTSFLMIRNDSLLYEYYGASHSRESINPSFSVAKTFVSALMGIAISEGFIKSTREPITNYLTELTAPGFEKIRIEDLLNMRSGISFNETYTSPFGQMPKYYYGLNLQKYVRKLRIEGPPDQHFKYISVNTLLLSMIIEKATGKKLSEYLTEKIWQPLGMEYPATMSIDSKKDQTIKAFCCLNARARDFAKFGRLYLNKGMWQGKQIVPEKWVAHSTSVINDSHDARGFPYTYQWRVTKEGNFFAYGVLGQYIYICPSTNTIFVRTGKTNKKADWPALFVELSKKH